MTDDPGTKETEFYAVEENEEFSDPKYVCSRESLGKKHEIIYSIYHYFYSSPLIKIDREIYE